MKLINVLTIFTLVFTLITPFPVQASTEYAPLPEASNKTFVIIPLHSNKLIDSIPLRSAYTPQVPGFNSLVNLTLNQTVIISDTGFIPGVAAPFVDEQVTWTNDSSQTCSLKLGTPGYPVPALHYLWCSIARVPRLRNHSISPMRASQFGCCGWMAIARHPAW